MHVQIWGDMLEQAGFKPSDIPTKWEDYGRSGATSAGRSRKATGRASTPVRPAADGRGIDRLVSSRSTPSWMPTNVKLVDDDGKLLVDDPKFGKT